jgi:hypothetical protein
LCRISADLLTAGIFVQQAVQWDLYASIGALLVLAGAITLLGESSACLATPGFLHLPRVKNQELYH